MRITLITVLLGLLTTLTSCGPKISTGRNEDPNQWPGRDTAPDEGQPEGPNDPAEPRGPNLNTSTTSCFRTPTSSLPTELQSVCDNVLKPNPLLVKIHNYLCVEKFLVSALQSPTCGWHGDPKNIMQFVATYEAVAESSGKDYEDVHATIVNPPASPETFIEFVRLAFENYAAFKERGYQWISGTGELSNRNRGTLESTVDYKFRVMRADYEIAYAGHIKLYPLWKDTWMHVNYGDAEFTRARSFAQVVIYSRQADGSVLVTKLEHKSVESGGLFRRAKQGSLDLTKDFMSKCWTNMAPSTVGAQ